MGQKNCIPGKSASGPQSSWGAGFHLMSAVAVSGTATATSQTFNAANLDNLGLQVTFTGTMTGTLTVVCSIDNVNYDALTFNPVLVQPAGSAIRYLINLNQLPFPYMRVVYANASGSGTLDVYLSAKDVN